LADFKNSFPGMVPVNLQ